MKFLNIHGSNFFNITQSFLNLKSGKCNSVYLKKNKGDIDDPNNYRGILLLSCFGELFRNCLNKRLKNKTLCKQNKQVSNPIFQPVIIYLS